MAVAGSLGSTRSLGSAGSLGNTVATGKSLLLLLLLLGITDSPLNGCRGMNAGVDAC